MVEGDNLADNLLALALDLCSRHRIEDFLRGERGDDEAAVLVRFDEVADFQRAVDGTPRVLLRLVFESEVRELDDLVREDRADLHAVEVVAVEFRVFVFREDAERNVRRADIVRNLAAVRDSAFLVRLDTGEDFARLRVNRHASRFQLRSAGRLASAINTVSPDLVDAFDRSPLEANFVDLARELVSGDERILARIYIRVLANLDSRAAVCERDRVELFLRTPIRHIHVRVGSNDAALRHDHVVVANSKAVFEERAETLVEQVLLRQRVMRRDVEVVVRAVDARSAIAVAREVCRELLETAVADNRKAMKMFLLLNQRSKSSASDPSTASSGSSVPAEAADS